MQVTVVLVIIILMLLGVIYLLLQKINDRKKEYDQLLNNYNGLNDEFMKLVETSKIKSDNRKKADEKIEELHNGNAVDNAVDILRKHKN